MVTDLGSTSTAMQNTVLCPQMYGLALGLFTKNLGLVGGIASAGCYLIVSVALAVVGALPENNQATLGMLYVVCGLAAMVLLTWATSRRASGNTSTQSPSHVDTHE
jgi:DHA1 family bicyclomycin/chloramphenicol resistance-like MFS transporter